MAYPTAPNSIETAELCCLLSNDTAAPPPPQSSPSTALHFIGPDHRGEKGRGEK
jgi:hypothetical protein